MWTTTQAIEHNAAALLLCSIKDEAFELMREKKNISEYDVQQFILDRFKEYNLKTAYNDPIVAFNENTQHIHYYPKKRSAKKLKNNTLVMLDIWARQNKPKAPFGDITWMAYKGSRIPAKVQKVYKIVVRARDAAISFVHESSKKGVIPTGKSIDAVARDIIQDAGFGLHMYHELGHSIGTTSPHGNRGWLGQNNSKPILTMGYTIEPAIYIEGEFGVRSEMDFYLHTDNNILITSEVQKDIIKL